MRVTIKWFDLCRVCKKTEGWVQRDLKRITICNSIKYAEYDKKPECKPENCPLLED